MISINVDQSAEGLGRVLLSIIDERSRQDAKWGDQSRHLDQTWLAILVEEVGESAQSLLHDKFGGHHAGTLRDELVQVAAVAVAWIETIDKRNQNDYKI